MCQIFPTRRVVRVSLHVRTVSVCPTQDCNVARTYILQESVQMEVTEHIAVSILVFIIKCGL